MNVYKLLYFALLPLAIFCSCGSRTSLSDTEKKGMSKAAQHHIQKIQVETSYCEGSCPVFRLTINDDRSATLEAIAYNRKQGNFKGLLYPRDYRELIRLLEDTRFDSLQAHYAVAMTDMSSVTLTIIYDNGRIKTISDYGLHGTPALERFYGFVFSLTESPIWE